MKQIIAYRCDFCKKVTVRKDKAKLHELGCFKNPESKSCITCEFLSDRLWLNAEERIATEHEMNIFALEVDGTFVERSGRDSYGDESDYKELLPEYLYLENSTREPYCNSLKVSLYPLRTRCTYHKTKI